MMILEADEHARLQERWTNHLGDMVESGTPLPLAATTMLEAAIAAHLMLRGPAELAKMLRQGAERATEMARCDVSRGKSSTAHH